MKPTPGAEKARKDRLRRLHERQAVVFGLLIAILVVTSLGALAIFTGAIDAPFNRGFSTPEVTSAYAGVKEPCLPDGTLPVPAKDIAVKVLNATETSGIAAENQEVLKERGFNVTGIDTSKKLEDRTQLRFGAAGIPAAYTLAAHFNAPLLLLDDRKDATVDLFIGTDFENTTDSDLTGLEPNTPMASVKGCAAATSIKPLKAPAPASAEVPPAN